MELIKRKASALALPIFVTLLYIFLYLPIIVFIVFSFNTNPYSLKWQGFTLSWYKELLVSSEVVCALKNSLIVAFSAVFLSVLMAVLYVFYGVGNFLNKLTIFFYGSLIAPEIVLATCLLSVFSFFSMPLGLTSLIAGHTLIGLAYTVPMIKSSFEEIDYKLIEASMDLGATESQTFYKIIVPILLPSIMSGAMLVLIISLDDFFISFFCSGAETLTLPMYIFSQIRAGATPMVNAISTLLMLASGLLTLILTSFKIKTRFF